MIAGFKSLLNFKSNVSTDSTIRALLLYVSNKKKSEKRVSNPRPQPWEGCALPTELFSLIYAAKVQQNLIPANLSLKNCTYYWNLHLLLEWALSYFLFRVFTNILVGIKNTFNDNLLFSIIYLIKHNIRILFYNNTS